MSQLSRDAESLIEEGRAGTEPQPDDKARIRARLVGELGAGAFASAAVVATVAGSTSASTAAAKLAKGASAWWFKGALAMATFTGSAVALYAAVVPDEPRAAVAGPAQSEPPTEEKSELDPVPPRHGISALAQSSGAVERAPNEPPALEAEAEPSEQPARRPARARARSRDERAERARGSAREGSEASLGNSMGVEVALLARAQRALREGQSAEALALAQQHARAFPDGELHQERDGVAALARCMLDLSEPERARARAQARVFLERAPSSPLAARVRKLCGLE